MKYFYDLHIHTCLSACADDDMTPNNIAGMAKLIGLDIIAITDHNSALNARAVSKASNIIDGPLVVPGTELETGEGIHTVILFPCFDSAEDASREIKRLLPKMPIRDHRQHIMDEFDNINNIETTYLCMPTEIGLYDVKSFADRYGAVCFPAHIDRGHGGILGVLGGIDRDMGFSALEITKFAQEGLKEEYLKKGYGIFNNSDAHSLHLINEKENFLQAEELSIAAVLDAIRNRKE